jgi:hypothetical protein
MFPSPNAHEAESKPNRFRRSFRIATGVLAIAIVALCMPGAIAFQRQHAAISAIYRSGGSVHGRFSGPNWFQARAADLGLGGFAEVGTVILREPGLHGREFQVLSEFPKLHTLFVDDGILRDQDIPKLPEIPRLRTLHIYDSDFSDQGLAALLERFPNVEELLLETRQLGDAGLASLERLDKLTQAALGAPKVSPAAIKKLQEARPSVTIVVYVPSNSISCHFAQDRPLR